MDERSHESIPESVDSDATLFRRFRAGDESALDLLLQRYEGPLFRFLMGVLKDSHAAEEALQETLVKVLEHHADADPEHLRGWLFRVAWREAMQQLRRERKHVAGRAELSKLERGELGPDEILQLQEDTALVQELLARLPESQKAVLQARFYDDKRFREIASALGCPIGTALTRMHQGLRRLRSMMGKKNV